MLCLRLKRVFLRSAAHTDFYTLESGIDVGQGINVGPWINVGHEQNVLSFVTKNPSILKISVGHGKNSKI